MPQKTVANYRYHLSPISRSRYFAILKIDSRIPEVRKTRNVNFSTINTMHFTEHLSRNIGRFWVILHFGAMERLAVATAVRGRHAATN